MQQPGPMEVGAVCYSTLAAAGGAFASAQPVSVQQFSSGCFGAVKVSYSGASDSGSLVYTWSSITAGCTAPAAVTVPYVGVPCELNLWSMTPEVGVAVSAAVAGVWLGAWCWKALVRTLRGSDPEP